MTSKQKTEQIKTMADMLFSKYNKLVLDSKECAEAIGRSEMSLSRDRSDKVGIPYAKIGRRGGSDKAVYTVTDIATHIVNSKYKVA